MVVYHRGRIRSRIVFDLMFKNKAEISQQAKEEGALFQLKILKILRAVSA